MMDLLLTPHSVLSLKDSSPEDNSLSEFFDSRLKTSYDYDDSPPEREAKEQVFQELKSIIDKWLSATATASSTTPSGQFLVFGSFRMQVNHKESDLDTICIVPNFVDRDKNFFGELFESLKTHGKVTDIYVISDAMVPLIKLKFATIPIDILFARMEVPSIPSDLDFLNNDEQLIKNIEEKSYKGLNGIRTAETINRSVKNLQEFRLFLKLIKLWAKNKLIYSSVMGYLGGISWAILASKICQLYPNYSAAKLLERFFFIYSLWIWEEMPVLLEPLKTTPEIAPNPKLLQFQWDEKGEKTEMSIITPAFPCMNSSHTVSITSSQIIRNSFRKGYKTIKAIRNKQKEWDSLFEKVKFFEKFPFFLEISIVAKADQGDFLVWRGHYESRLRKFIRILENLKYHKFMTFQLNPNGFERKDEEFPFCYSYYVGMKISEDNTNQAKLLGLKEIDLDSAVRTFLDTVVQSHSIIPEHLNTKVRIVGKGDLDQGIVSGNKLKETKKEVKTLMLKDKIRI